MHTEASPPAHVPVRRALGQHWSAARGLRREVWVKGSFEADAGRAGGTYWPGIFSPPPPIVSVCQDGGVGRWRSRARGVVRVVEAGVGGGR